METYSFIKKPAQNREKSTNGDYCAGRELRREFRRHQHLPPLPPVDRAMLGALDALDNQLRIMQIEIVQGLAAANAFADSIFT